MSLDLKNKNKIDHLLTTDMEIIQNISVVNRFDFCSDHKMCRGTVSIPYHIKHQNYRKAKETVYTFMPLEKVTQAKEFLSNKLEKIDED